MCLVQRAVIIMLYGNGSSKQVRLLKPKLINSYISLFIIFIAILQSPAPHGLYVLSGDAELSLKK